MLSKPLIITALVFQVVGMVWDFIFHVQNGGLNTFFEAPHWPIFVGVILLLVAVLQSRVPKEVDSNKDKKFLP